jgi:hypothetical protein
MIDLLPQNLGSGNTAAGVFFDSSAAVQFDIFARAAAFAIGAGSAQIGT